VQFEAEDGYPLVGHLYAPVPQAAPPYVRGCVVINSGAGIPQRFFGKLAAWLASQGFWALTYDYRGIGDSRTVPFRQLNVKAHQWGMLDMQAAFAFALSQHPEAPLLALNHSMGGQLMGMPALSLRLKGAVFVGSGTGSQHNYPLRIRLKHGLMWRGFLPAYGHSVGYLPKWVMGGVDVPAGAAFEWKKWCHSRDYLFEHLGRSIPASANHYAQLRIPIVAYHFTDDTIITLQGVRHLLRHYPDCAITERVYAPAQLQLPRIGHTAFFRPQFEATLWQQLLQDLEAMLV
jgi:predicted alpha/beta hydrolase